MGLLVTCHLAHASREGRSLLINSNKKGYFEGVTSEYPGSGKKEKRVERVSLVSLKVTELSKYQADPK